MSEPSNFGAASSQRVSGFTESVIREMTRLSFFHGAVNLSRAFPTFPRLRK
jgi:hypothetical protein